MKRKFILTIALFLGLILEGTAQKSSYNENVQRYINEHKKLAMAEQKRTGVPAAIKLGQGILETAAGTSELKLNANNHFGIKCKKEWRGETYQYTDDAPNECFRKYKCTEDSYRDHSDYLRTGTRYAALFTLPVTDYAGWATGLKRCGYATNPRYTQQLIRIIEDFKLQDYTLLAMNDTSLEPDAPLVASAAPVPAGTGHTTVTTTTVVTTQTNGKYTYTNNDQEQQEQNTLIPEKQKAAAKNGIVYINGLKAIQAHKGDVLLEAAMKYNIRYARLLELNELPDAPLEADMYIFLEKKKTKGIHEKHTLKNGETLLQVAQAEGMQLKSLRAYNYLDANEVPVAGSVLNLRENAQGKPATTLIQPKQEEVARTQAIPATGSQEDYIPTVPAKTTQAGRNLTQADKTTTPQPASITPIENQASTPAPQEETAPAQEEKNIAAATPASITHAPAKPVNIADETAVEEEQEDDDIARLKAKMDKAVYNNAAPAKTTAPQQQPAKGTTAASGNGSTGSTQYYIVQNGDTGYSIAKKNNISMRQLMEWNGLQNFEKIKPGQKLKVKP